MKTKPPTGRSTIKNDPFAAVIPFGGEPEIMDGPGPAPKAEAEPAPVTDKPAGSTPVANRDRREVSPAEPARGRRKLTVHLPFELAERVKNAAYWNPRLTIAGIAEQGIKAAIEKVERENGGRYPPREGDLIGGRPIK